MPFKPRKPKPPSQRHLLPWGYDAPTKANLSLDDFIEIITKEDEESFASSEIKNVLIYWDRGTYERGDEAKMQEMNINSDILFAHVIDSQEWFLELYPKGRSGQEKHNLGEAAHMMGVDVTTQDELNNMTETEREYALGAMRHNGAGDSDLTVCVTAEQIRRRIAELEAQDGRRRKISSKYCFWGLDFEGGGRIGKGTTEIGLTKLWASDLEELGQCYWSAVESRHAIILETFDDHLCRNAQDGRIAIDDRQPETYPRWNFRGGPNATTKCTYIFQKTRSSTPKLFEMSVDSEIISMADMTWWVSHQIPLPLGHDRANQVANNYSTPASSKNAAYPAIAIVDSQNQKIADRLAGLQVHHTHPRHHQVKKPRARVEEQDWCM